MEKTDGARARQILEGVEALVVQRRSLALSFSEISEALNISRSLIYVYYDSLEEVLDALFAEHLDRLEGAILPMLDVDAPFRDRALAGLRSYFSYCVKNGPILQLILREARGDSPLGAGARARFRKRLRMLAKETCEGLDVKPREAFVILELMAAIPEALARVVRDEQVDQPTATATCDRLVLAAFDSLSVSKAG